jgi:hypothetical protein
MEKTRGEKKNEHLFIVLIIFLLLLIPALVLFGGKPYT